MKNYDHIKKMEKILNDHEKKLKELTNSLDYLSEHMDDFKELIHYYYSDQRQEDLRDEQLGKIPEDLKRRVFSEDEIYNLITDYYKASIKMLDLASSYFKSY